MCKELVEMLMALGNAEVKAKVEYFFKTGKGQYGEGDQFIGLKVPTIRQTIKPYQHQLSPLDAELLVQSPFHEIRLAGLLIWVAQFKKAKDPQQQKAIVDLYLKNTKHVNNWDLVDLSCVEILGGYLQGRPKDLLFKLSLSESLWEQRIAMVTTLAFIRKNEHDTALLLCEHFLSHRHDLMHKASGWCLREIGKKNKAALVAFLDQHAAIMPRTMLRYSIEKMDDEERKYYLDAKERALKHKS